jgi:hypothetical protein
MRRHLLPLLGLAAFAWGAPLGAQVTMDNVAVHGYGGWSYGRTSENDNTNFYLFGHQRGDYSHAEYALNVAVALSDRLTIDAQPFWHAGHHANQTSSGIDYVFGEWKFSDHMRLRAGSVKHPFGIYTEVFDVGTVRPFAALPQGVYGPAGMVGKAYDGIGLTGSAYSRSGWGVSYDMYGGGLETFELDVPLQVVREGTDTSKVLNVAQTRAFRDVVGGRLVINTPITGLNFGVSGYTGTRPLAKEQRRNTYGVHAEYTDDMLTFRAELAHETDPTLQSATGNYVEAAYRLMGGFQIAGMYSTLNTDLVGVSAANIARASTALDHNETGAGLNYWFAPNFVLKTSVHWVDGNRFAYPDPTRIRAIVATGQLRPKTTVVLVGSQLSF